MNAVAKPATPYPLRHLVSAAEYLRMGESGVFARETRLELIEGEVVEMAPIGSPHAGTVIALIDLFSLKIGRQALLSAQSPLALSDLSVPQPDLAVLRRREDHYTRTHPTPSDALLIVEVSDTTRDFDLGAKATLYARGGVAELWVVDVHERAIRVFRDASDSGWRSSFTATGMDRIVCQGLPTLELTVSEVFPSA